MAEYASLWLVAGELARRAGHPDGAINVNHQVANVKGNLHWVPGVDLQSIPAPPDAATGTIGTRPPSSVYL